MLLQPITVPFSKSTLKPSVYTLRLVYKPQVKSFKLEFQAFPGTFSTVVCR